MFKGEQSQPSAQQSGGGERCRAKGQGVMWSNCKIEKLHAIILQAECGDVKGRTNDGALSLLEDFSFWGAAGYKERCSPAFSPLPFLGIYNATVNPAPRGLMLQGCF